MAAGDRVEVRSSRAGLRWYTRGEWVGALLSVGLWTGCAQLPDDATPSNDTPVDETEGATLCQVQARIFTPQCEHCHAGAGAAAGLDLSDGRAYAELVGVPSLTSSLMLVRAGDSSQSYLYHKVAGTFEDVGGGGSLMPLGGAALSAEDLALLQAWIDEGASEACTSAPTPTPDPNATPTMPPEPTPTPSIPDTSTFCDVQASIFNPYCVSCHAGAYPSGGLALTSDVAHEQLFNVPSLGLSSMDRVEPNNPSASYLYLKVTNAFAAAGGSGSNMPLGGAALSPALLSVLETWILEGASADCGNQTPPPTPEPTPPPPPTPTPAIPSSATFCDVQATVFDGYCTGCHAGSNPSGKLSLQGGVSYAQVVGVAASQLPSMQRVLGGAPEQSYLYHKIAGTHASVGGSGSTMPQGGPPLPAGLQTLVFDWIQAGASEDCGTWTPPPTPVPTPTPPPPSGDLVPLCGVQQQIFNPYCTGCHAGGGASAGLDLSSANAYAELVNVKASQVASMNRVTPLDTNQSYLYHKLAGTHASVGGSGERMPKGDPALSTAQLKLVQDWILLGAPEYCEATGESLPDTVIISEARGDRDKGELRVRGEVTEIPNQGVFAGSVELFADGLNTDGTACVGRSLGVLTVDSADGAFDYDQRDLAFVPSTVCVESEGGGLAEASVRF
ncbi:MAG: hypothetical protein ACKO6N_10095 [Myxococcota bacterium]